MTATSKYTPLLVVFGLDYVFWPFWVNNQVTPPFHKNKTGEIGDFWNKEVTHYPDVVPILEKVKKKGIKMAAVSNNIHDDGTAHLVELFGFDKYFEYMEFYPGIITQHFEEIQTKSGINYTDMLYFDDSNISVKEMIDRGVYALEVKHGLTTTEFDNGLHFYEEKKKNEANATPEPFMR